MRIIFLLLCSLLLTACKHEQSTFIGYIDVDLTYLSSNYPGRLSELLVYRGQSVQKDQMLFKLERTEEHLNLDNQQLNKKALLAQKQELLAQQDYLDIQYHRTLRMQQHHAASQNDLDMAIKDKKVLKYQLDAIDAQIEGSQVGITNRHWQITRKESRANGPGIIFDTYFTPEEYVQAGQPVVSLITTNHIKAIFFVAEQELSHLRLQAPVSLSADGSKRLVKGHISYISRRAQYTPPIIYSREERQKLVFRVEARLDHPDLNTIHLGQPITLTLIP